MSSRKEYNKAYGKKYREEKGKEFLQDYQRKWYIKNKKKAREYWLVSTYGIDNEEYNSLFEKQEGRCAICRKHQAEFKRALAVDHCHESQKIRGLLCTSCNNGLGRFKDSKEFLANAIKYLSNGI